MSFAKSTRSGRQRSFTENLSRPAATLMIVSLLAVCVPRRALAKYTDESGNLPGIASTGAVIGAGAAAAAGIGLLIYFWIHHKGAVTLHVDHASTIFTDVTPGQTANEMIDLSNTTSNDVQIKSIKLDGNSSAFRLGELPSFPVTLIQHAGAFQIPVVVSANSAADSARIEMEISTVNSTKIKEATETFRISYRQKKSK